MNPKQRARWLSDIITDLQRFLAKSAGDAERVHAQRALESLQDGRAAALSSKEDQ